MRDSCIREQVSCTHKKAVPLSRKSYHFSKSRTTFQKVVRLFAYTAVSATATAVSTPATAVSALFAYCRGWLLPDIVLNGAVVLVEHVTRHALQRDFPPILDIQVQHIAIDGVGAPLRVVGCGQRNLIAADSETIGVAHELVPLAVVFYQVTPHRLAVVGKDIGLIAKYVYLRK